MTVNPLQMTAVELLMMARDMQGLLRITLDDDKDNVKAAVIVIADAETAQDVLAAIDLVESRWEGDRSS